MVSIPNPIELVFKKVDGLDITMDIYIPGSASAESPAPVLLWWHGGGLLQGTRKAVVPHMLSAPDKHKLCIISPDYRLAPQTPDGWLSLLNGTGIGPVSGIAALYPITDLLDPFWHTKQHPVSYMERVIPKEEVERYLDPTSPKTAGSAVDAPRSIFYHYMVQEGILTSLLLDGTRISPNAFSIAENIKSGKFTPPPTYIIHGTIDDKVPIVQATDVVEALKQMDSRVEYCEMPGLDHSFDKDPNYDMLDMYKFIFTCVGERV
ncbi:Alpha/Beta hydrolase protein [Cyathus striatus]|nr:Alpha/Beta hydrolase protein [Cyathus striatus]